MKWNMDQWLGELTARKKRNAFPVMTYPGLHLTGKGIMDAITGSEAQASCMEALAKRYPSAAASTIMDLSVEAEAFGSSIRFSWNEVPSVTGNIVRDMGDAQKLPIPAVGSGRTEVYLKAASMASSVINDRPVLGCHIGPFSLAARLFGMTEIMIAVIEEPETVHTVVEKCAVFLGGYAVAFKEAGANGVIIAEPAAGLLSPSLCDEFSSGYIKKIVETVQDKEFAVMLHNCGNTVKLVDSMVSTGAKALHFGNAVKMADILPQVPGDRVAFGNIDPAGVFRNGSAEDVRRAVAALIDETAEYRNFVISSGCDIPPGTPLENLDAFFTALNRS